VGPPAPYITVTNNNADLTIIPMNGTQPNQSGGERLDIYGNCNGTQSCQLLLSLNCSTPPANDATFFSQDVNNGKGVSHVNMVFFVLGNGVVQINAYVDGVLGKEIWFNNSDGACQLIDINPGL